MMTALDAKLTAYRNRPKGYFHIAESRIEEATSFGNLECAVDMDEVPDGTLGMLCEVACLLNELGYQTMIDDNKRIHIYWGTKRHLFYDVMGSVDEEEE